MKHLLLLALLTTTAHAASEDWIQLFDGESTAGWTPRAKTETFEARDGELHLLARTNCWVTTDIEMGDFEAELEVLLPPEAGFNSGLAFRCQGAKGKPKGYQVEIDRSKPAGIYGIGLGGWLYPDGAQQTEYAATIDGLLKPQRWNHFRVRAQGGRIRTWLNGTPVADLQSQAQLEGYFGIQHHGKGGTVKFRNIRARALAKPAVSTPNILWITAEDMSPTLGCYGDRYASTPNLDRFAKRSTRYDNAFAASPVCSPSRSTLITGMYNVTTGTHQMRSGFPLPQGVAGFPSYLRDAGYFTTNNVKTDYNTSDAERVIDESWDFSSPKAHWRDASRADGQPFFAVFNLMTSHQSRTMVWPYAAFEKHVQSKLCPGEIHDPNIAPVPPYYPDTALVRKTVARYYDCVTAMDKEVGILLDQLQEDGLADDTIVFFYSDHGSGMPRHKRLLTDSGMRVAMLVHLPEKWQHLRPTAPGESTDQLVSFVDFAPTVLALTGSEIPDHMQGIPFLASDRQREIVYGTRDRVDEVFECARSVRDKRWLYIRNYHPHRSWNQPSVFSDLGEIRGEINGTPVGEMSAAQRHYAGPRKSAEELYDCLADPQNTQNLASGQPAAEIRRVLERMRATLASERQHASDLGALPEGEMRRWVNDEGKPMHDIALGRADHAPDLLAAWRAADLVGDPDVAALLEVLQKGAPAERYWAIIGLRNAAFEDTELHQQLADWLDDTSPAVRIETAEWLANFPAHRTPALERLADDLLDQDWAVALHACRAIELLGEHASALKPSMRALYERTRHEPGDEHFFIAFSSGAFLAKLGEETDPWDFSPDAGSFTPQKKEEPQKAEEKAKGNP